MTQITRKGSEVSKRQRIARRQFLSFLAGSPLLTASTAGAIASLLAASSHPVRAQSYDVLRASRRALGPDGIITAPADALDVFEFEPAAKKAVLSQSAPAHWGYLESGVEGDVTRDANHTGRGRRERPHPGTHRWRRAPWHRRPEGAWPWCQRCRHWPSLRVGARLVRRGRRGPRARDPGR